MANRIKLDSADKTPPAVIAAIGDNAAAYPKDKCIPCGAVINIGFFFDGFGRSRDHDDPTTSRYSNISRLWEAHRENSDPRRKDMPNQFWYRFYYSGLGTELNQEAQTAQIASAGVKLLKASAEMAGSQATDTAKKISGIDKLSINPSKAMMPGLKDGLEDYSLRPVVKAFEDLTKDIENTPAKIGRVLTLAQDDRWVRRGRAAGRAILYDLKKHPMKAGWAVAQGIFVGVAVDSIPWFRDNAAVAGILGTGVNDRLAAAMKQFEKAYLDAKSTMPKIQRIKVSVFGADRGGVIARAFVNQLVEKYKHRDATDLAIVEGQDSYPIELKFLGLLDAVSSLMEENKLLDMVPVLGMVKQNFGDQNLAVPAAVQRCVHFAAAHELRFYQRLDSLEQTFGVQYLYPGTSEDVTGGSPAGSLGARAELQRVALRDMLNEAISAGASLDTIEDLFRNKGPTFQKFSLAQPISDGRSSYQILDLIKAYREVVPYVARLNFLDHMQVFLRWMAVRYRSPAFRESVTSHVDTMKAHHQQLVQQRQQAEAAYLAERNRASANTQSLMQAQVRMDAARQAESDSLRATTFELSRPFVNVWDRIQNEANEMTRRASYQDSLQSSADRIRAKADSNDQPWDADPEASADMVEAAMMPADQATLAQAWKDGLSGKKPLPPQVMALFDLMVHDTMLTSWHDHVLSATLYFQTRATDTFGKTDYVKDEKKRQHDRAAADRIDQIGRSMTQDQQIRKAL
ncbi:DUF2235 domain-containing protein [Paraburkholderia nemoris]|uniref:hypothetical protein n=1 Tax=Paraburkholderia nemoris TaxID=2793076 RepID=UPI0038BD80AB